MVGAGELLALAARGESSDVWVPLLSALLGAIVGGLTALLGSVLVKRWELKKTTRIRMYDELMPALYREFRPSSITIVQRDRGHGGLMPLRPSVSSTARVSCIALG
jgi:hypothetical protein